MENSHWASGRSWIVQIFCLSVALFRTGNAQGGGRLEFQPTRVDGLIAVGTIAIAAVVAALQGRLDAAQFLFRPLAGAVRHGLLLQGVHPGKAADAALVQRHGGGGGVARIRQAPDAFAGSDELVSEVVDIRHIALISLISIVVNSYRQLTI